MKMLEEILNDYPRIWEFYKNDNSEKTRAPKFAQRYPLPMATLSMIIDFEKWTHKTTLLVSSEIGIQLPNHVRKTEVGPNPVVMYRLHWLNQQWSVVENRKKSLAKTLSDDIIEWHTRIRVKVNDGNTYAYDPVLICNRCFHRSIVRFNDGYLCVNPACKNPLTGSPYFFREI
jgi:hypothetical protein